MDDKNIIPTDDLLLEFGPFILIRDLGDNYYINSKGINRTRLLGILEETKFKIASEILNTATDF